MRWWPVLLVGLLGCGGERRRVVLPPQLGPSGQMVPYDGGMRLPVEGRWRVYRTHYGSTNDQGTAVDLVRDARVSGRGERNEDHPSYGEPIVAAAPGEVVIAVDGVPDNAPRRVNGYDMHGNYVVLDHGSGVFSLYAHFIPRSLRVKVGEVVAGGQPLGACGNSGHSTRPHLHFQVMDHWLAHRAEAVPVPHLTYRRNGENSTARMEKGDVIETK